MVLCGKSFGCILLRYFFSVLWREHGNSIGAQIWWRENGKTGATHATLLLIKEVFPRGDEGGSGSVDGGKHFRIGLKWNDTEESLAFLRSDFLRIFFPSTGFSVPQIRWSVSERSSHSLFVIFITSNLGGFLFFLLRSMCERSFVVVRDLAHS